MSDTTIAELRAAAAAGDPIAIWIDDADEPVTVDADTLRRVLAGDLDASAEPALAALLAAAD